MHQSTTPSLSQTIWPRWASRQFLSLPIVQTLLPVTFGYSLSTEAVVMRQLRRWSRQWRRSLTRSHAHTHFHCSRRRLLRRWLKFHVCTINKSAHTKKSGNLFNDPGIKYIWFGFVWFGFMIISTVVGYLMPNPLYTYILNISDFVGLGFMTYQLLKVI